MSLTKIQKRSLFLATLMTGVLMGWMPAFSQERGAVTPITDGSKVTIAFTITVPESRVTIPDNVSEYVSGQHQLIPALETALTGLTAGERKRVDLEPDQAFGPYDNAKMHTIQRDQLPPDAKTGLVYQTRHGQPFTIVGFTDNTAVVDFNHPLAGKSLVFDVQVLKVEQGS